MARQVARSGPTRWSPGSSSPAAASVPPGRQGDAHRFVQQPGPPRRAPLLGGWRRAQQGDVDGAGHQPRREVGGHAQAHRAPVAVLGHRGAQAPHRVLDLPCGHDEVPPGVGESFEVRVLGTVQELEAEIARRRAVATDPMEYVFLQHQWSTVGGEGKLQHVDDGAFPDITPTTVARFLAPGLPTAP